MSMAELGRLVTPGDGAKANYTVSPDANSLIVQNQLSGVIYGAWGRQATATEWDFVVPGSSYFVTPTLGGQARLYVLVRYSAAIPAADVQAVFSWSACNHAPFVGPLA